LYAVSALYRPDHARYPDLHYRFLSGGAWLPDHCRPELHDHTGLAGLSKCDHGMQDNTGNPALLSESQVRMRAARVTPPLIR
jgi:hypothetical protein